MCMAQAWQIKQIEHNCSATSYKKKEQTYQMASAVQSKATATPHDSQGSCTNRCNKQAGWTWIVQNHMTIMTLWPTTNLQSQLKWFWHLGAPELWVAAHFQDWQPFVPIICQTHSDFIIEGLHMLSIDLAWHGKFISTYRGKRIGFTHQPCTMIHQGDLTPGDKGGGGGGGCWQHCRQ